MSPVDGRIAAWSRAWQLIVMAQQWRVAMSNDQALSANMPDQYWAMLHEAEAFTALVHAPADVGIAAGTTIHEAYEAEITAAAESASIKIDDFLNTRRPKNGEDEHAPD